MDRHVQLCQERMGQGVKPWVSDIGNDFIKRFAAAAFVEEADPESSDRQLALPAV